MFDGFIYTTPSTMVNIIENNSTINFILNLFDENTKNMLMFIVIKKEKTILEGGK